jgi:hypothetical protein
LFDNRGFQGLALGFDNNPPGINQDNVTLSQSCETITAIAGQPRFIGYQSIAATRELVEERTFPDIWAPNQGYQGCVHELFFSN